MNFQFYVEKLFASGDFQEFMKENKDAYPCSGFFMVDRENMKNPGNQAHFDFYVPSINRMFSFKMEEGVQKVSVELSDPDYAINKASRGRITSLYPIEDQTSKWRSFDEPQIVISCNVSARTPMVFEIELEK